MKCEKTCKGFKKIGLDACEGCARNEERKPLVTLEMSYEEWLRNF
jgi:hypothetical protein